LGGQSLVVLADPSPTQLYTLSLHDALPIFTEHLERWGYLSSNELAVQLGVHRSTVVRFAQHIGFPGYPGLQEAARAEYLRSLSKPGDLVLTDRGEGDPETVQAVYQREQHNLQRSYTHLDLQALEATARGLAKARRV